MSSFFLPGTLRDFGIPLLRPLPLRALGLLDEELELELELLSPKRDRRPLPPKRRDFGFLGGRPARPGLFQGIASGFPSFLGL